MTTRERIQEKLVELTSYIDDLKRFQSLGWADFQANVMLRRGIERTLQVATECALDIGNMIISHNQWRAAESNRDVFQVLADHELVPSPLLDSLLKMASFRNILVHEYTRVDASIVFALMKKTPQDLLELRDQITARL